MATKKQETTVQEALDQILETVIDEWYDRVSGYYVTEEGSSDADGRELEVELKRFHDDNGHRIKFNKDNLDFTYGLRCSGTDDRYVLEVSVNNKVEEFDYEDFKEQLFAHYRDAGAKKVTRPAKLKKPAFNEVFLLEHGISKAFIVERRDDRADIMRLSFQISPKYLEILASDGAATKMLVESYCVSPFRNIYARVYRSG